MKPTSRRLFPARLLTAPPSFLRIGQPPHEQDAAALVVLNQKHEWMIGPEFGQFWWRIATFFGPCHYRCGGRGLGALFIDVDDCFVNCSWMDNGSRVAMPLKSALPLLNAVGIPNAFNASPNQNMLVILNFGSVTLTGILLHLAHHAAR